MKVINVLFLILFCTASVYAQHRPIPATAKVLAALDSAILHQKENTYLSYLEKAEALAIENSDNNGIALVNQRLGGYYYARDARKAIAYQKKASEFFYKAEDAKMVAICMHNIGYIYDEQLHNTDSAINAIDAAIYLHKKLRDTLEFANMCKYKGILVARLGDYTEAKRLVNKAILYFGYKDYQPGIAVSWYDLALVYGQQEAVDSAICYAEKSKDYWMRNKGMDRVFGINTELVKWYLKAGKQQKATKLLSENKSILDSDKIYWKDKLAFYQIAEQYSKNVKRNTDAKQYKLKYTGLRDSLNAEGVKTE